MASGQFHHKVSVSYRFMVPKGLFCLFVIGAGFFWLAGWSVGHLTKEYGNTLYTEPTGRQCHFYSRSHWGKQFA